MYGYDWAVGKLNGRDRRKLENNTYLERESPDTIVVRLHQTPVVIYHKNGDIELFSGGWRTLTTRDRINTYAPVRIHQSAGVWYVDGDGVTFADGMRIKPSGEIVGGGPDPKAQNRARARVRAFAAEFIERLRRGEIPAPSGGDCWYCLMREVGTGKPLGEISRDGEHIRDHIKHKYFVPSLLVNALNWRGSVAMKSLVYSRFQGEDRSKGWPESEYLWRDIRKSLTRYCYSQLGMTV